MDAVIFTVGDNHYQFMVEINAAKSFKDFYEHEKHHSLTKEQLKEVHDLCRANAKKVVKEEAKEIEKPE